MEKQKVLNVLKTVLLFAVLFVIAKMTVAVIPTDETETLDYLEKVSILSSAAIALVGTVAIKVLLPKVVKKLKPKTNQKA